MAKAATSASTGASVFGLPTTDIMARRTFGFQFSVTEHTVSSFGGLGLILRAQNEEAEFDGGLLENRGAKLSRKILRFAPKDTGVTYRYSD